MLGAEDGMAAVLSQDVVVITLSRSFGSVSGWIG
jgi:hypothetical protein